jgi:isocitrate dehydrogenase (NAD+)
MKIGVIKGNGIGPEITEATLLALEATGIPFEWVPVMIGDEAIDQYGHPLPQESVKLLRELKVSFKGPFIVNKLKGRLRCVHDDGTEYVYPSLNNAIRRELNLFVCPRPIRGIPNISGKYEDLDVVVMREITEDVYSGIEHSIGGYAAECIKLITREAAVRVAEYSFDYARKNGRKKVTCVHKANAISITDGLFLTCFREVAARNTDIESDDCMVDAAAFHLITHPKSFDVITTTNQYGDILSDVCAGLVGSMGLAAGGNIGKGCAVFEASHGAAPDIAGKGIANPVALMLSGAFMLRHLGYTEQAALLEHCIRSVLSDGKNLTPDLGGSNTCMGLAELIAKRLASSGEGK